MVSALQINTEQKAPSNHKQASFHVIFPEISTVQQVITTKYKIIYLVKQFHRIYLRNVHFPNTLIELIKILLT